MCLLLEKVHYTNTCIKMGMWYALETRTGHYNAVCYVGYWRLRTGHYKLCRVLEGITSKSVQLQ